MKNLFIKSGIGVLSVGALAFAATVPASAQTVIPDGHVDIVEVTGQNGGYEVETHIESSAGHFHVDPANIGNYEFVIDLGNANATWDGDVVTIPSGVNDAVVTDFGFNYHGSGDDAVIQWFEADDAAVTFEGDDAGYVADGTAVPYVLEAGEHEHGAWTYEVDDASDAEHEFELSFVVTVDDNLIDVVTPVSVTLVGSGE